ncbi:MAG TPA: hypothetical protein VGK32_17440 [Vicinamibacterales bacterium]
MLFGPMREEVNEIADSKISVHDRHRFEIKLDIELADHDASGYRVDTYFFVPRALNVNPNTYSKDLFYSSIQRYIRFKTPQFSLLKIIEPSNDASPLVRIGKELRRVLAGDQDRESVEAIFCETKLLGAVSRGAIRDAVKELLGGLAGDQPGDSTTTPAQGFITSTEAFLDDLDAYLAAVRNLRQEMLDITVPLRLREGFLFFDEFISLTIQDYLSTLLHAVRERFDPTGSCAHVDAAMAAIIIGQQSHRKSMGYPSVLSTTGTDSTLLYRRGVLKKFISNVLFLNTEVSEWEGISQIPLAMAAGFAMLFAVGITVFAQNRYTTNSIPFVAAVVVGYVFKDRLKDWLKLYLSRGLVRWTADRKIRIRDPYSGRVIGKLKEAFSFTDESRLPETVLYCRQMDNITSIDEEGKPERIIKYEKEVSLFPARISRFHERRRDLNDIMRLNIDDFLRQADDATVDYLNLDPDSGQLQQVQCQRVYHVNIVFTYRSIDAKRQTAERVERIRLVLNRDGIVRLDQVAPAHSLG